MIIVILLAALALIGLVATVVEIHRDGYRAAPTDWTRVAEHDTLRDAESTVAYR
ncbi:hypothetical protein [Microbacterium abyssi]|uniref:hypothetical protein n=1 Tax=Microbacterium abyssi TaxID=2782166 RepID=UPI001887CBFE|nr:hypothetical protein [Microbacterium sp. A18JL241]